MKTKHVLAILAALVVAPFVLSWGALLLVPAALLLVPCVLLAMIAAVPALLAAATSVQHDAAPPQRPVPTRPVYST